MISERVVLFGIQNLEQSGCRIATIIRAQLVDLVQHHYRIIDARAPDRLNNPPRHRADVSTPMPAQFGFIANTSEAQPLEVATHGAGNRSAQRGLANAGRPDETEDWTLGIGAQFPYRQKFQNSLFYIFEAVVIFVQNFSRLVEIKPIFRRLFPRQLQDKIQIRANDVVIRSH